MTILSKGYPGFTLVCEQCNSLLAYNSKDVYEGKYVYCAVCKHKNEVPTIIDAKIVEKKNEQA